LTGRLTLSFGGVIPCSYELIEALADTAFKGDSAMGVSSSMLQHAKINSDVKVTKKAFFGFFL